jgi:hypothetical protein
MVAVHRLMYQFAYGNIRPEDWVLHKCDVPRCCNPAHLFLGDHAANMADMMRKGRRAYGEKIMRNKLTTEQALLVLSLKGKAEAADLADKYGVRNGAITNIWSGRAWKHLRSPEKTTKGKL